jgi:hypothetical protein
LLKFWHNLRDIPIVGGSSSPGSSGGSLHPSAFVNIISAKYHNLIELCLNRVVFYPTVLLVLNHYSPHIFERLVER